MLVVGTGAVAGVLGPGADLTGIDDTDGPLVTLPGGLPLFLAGCKDELSSAFRLLFIIPGGPDLGLVLSLSPLVLVDLSLSPPDLDVCDVSSSDELELLSESELSESELLDSILLTFFLTG